MTKARRRRMRWWLMLALLHASKSISTAAASVSDLVWLLEMQTFETF
jgi:hypothetical protein